MVDFELLVFRVYFGSIGKAQALEKVVLGIGGFISHFHFSYLKVTI